MQEHSLINANIVSEKIQCFLTIMFFALLSSNGFTVQTSWYMGMHKPKPRSTFSGYFYLSSCSLILYMY